MALFPSYFIIAILAAQAYCIPTSGNNRRQATLPSFVNTYGELTYDVEISIVEYCALY